jgi:hypothetical protein
MGDKSRYKHWYVYLYGHPLNPESYQLVTVKPRCSNGTNLCAIYADGYEDQPFEFSNKLKMHIANAIALGEAQPYDSEWPVVLLRY